MPKPITIEMLEAMNPDQRKTLYQNALNLATPAATAIIAMLDSGDLMGRPAPKAVAPKRAAKKSATTKHGRQS